MKILSKIPVVVVWRENPNFDRACEQALRMAVSAFGIDEAGHARQVPGHDRSRDSIRIEFKRYRQSDGMHGQEYQYTFEARMVRDEEADS